MHFARYDEDCIVNMLTSTQYYQLKTRLLITSDIIAVPQRRCYENKENTPIAQLPQREGRKRFKKFGLLHFLDQANP